MYMCYYGLTLFTKPLIVRLLKSWCKWCFIRIQGLACITNHPLNHSPTQSRAHVELLHSYSDREDTQSSHSTCSFVLTWHVVTRTNMGAKRWVTYCNPSYISTGGALYWTLWVLPLTSLCERSPTEIFINVAGPGGGPTWVRAQAHSI